MESSIPFLARKRNRAAFEDLVAHRPARLIAYSGINRRLYFSRTARGTEVDFMVYGGDGFWTLKVKNTAIPVLV